jgi:ferredoxin-like protein FixX
MSELKIDLKRLVKRSGDTGEFITFHEERCNGCGLCVDVCSMGLWSVKDKRARISKRYAELCLECAGCWEICEPEAIEFWYPKGGTGVVIQYG